ncbi:tetratricopeptide repeat protein [Flavihumibacter rivuli]|uniref:tetratricopeptide repeat protein n=1 Tax=Flavihumibacter rivuli TaxID=2838156 RepID=UPI001BDE1384|nr:tetratricopeptide repeat protein [Flavihumibacter rivuli]ULQ55640.1 tetratricopeptide repeat protein [Flavihumibacter rivuli]
MRKLLTIACCGLSTLAAAQSIDEAKQLIYYDRLESAENILQKIRESGEEKDVLYWLSEVYFEKDSISKAKELLLQPSDAGMLNTPLNKVALGKLLLQEGKVDEAKGLFEEALKDSRHKDAEVVKAIMEAQVETRSGDPDYAINVFESVKKKSVDARFYTLIGDAYRKKGDGGEAAKAYMNALLEDDKFAEAAYKLGKIYLTQQNTEMFLKHFNKAIAADPNYAPAYYELYYYYYFRDVNKAKEYLDQYIAHTDPSEEHQLMQADLLFVSGKYDETINSVRSLIEEKTNAVKPRLLKMMAYSFDAKGDATQALQYIDQYFQKAPDSSIVAKDHDLKASLLAKMAQDSLAIDAWTKALQLDTVNKYRIGYMQNIASLYKKQNLRSNEAAWLGKIYQEKEDANNLDIYNWGLAHYAANEFQLADSVFSIYVNKYPEQVYGYYWRARSRAQVDSTMEQGLAYDDYRKVTEIAAADPQKNKSLLIQSYGYLGAFDANTKKDYPLALEWFEKILALDPDNQDAQKFSGILKKWVADGGPK